MSPDSKWTIQTNSKCPQSVCQEYGLRFVCFHWLSCLVVCFFMGCGIDRYQKQEDGYRRECQRLVTKEWHDGSILELDSQKFASS